MKKMNTLILDKENMIHLKDNTYELDIKENEVTLLIEGTVCIKELKKTNKKKILNIILKDNATLLYNHFSEYESSVVINIEQTNNTKVLLNYSSLVENACYIKMHTHIIGNHNTTTLKIRAVTEKKGQAIIEATAEVEKGIKENQLLEDIKIIMTSEEESKIIPNLLVSSNEVEVNHAATISGINPDDLFYLNTKGIEKKEAESIIKKGFLLSHLLIEKEEIKKIIGGDNLE